MTGPPNWVRAAGAGRARRDAVADSGPPRRLRHRPHDAAAAAARSPRPRRRAVHRRRAHRHHARAVPRRRHQRRRRSRWHDAGTGRRPRAAFDAPLAFFDTRPRARRRAGTFLLDELLELRTFESFPACATCCTSCSTALADERQPLRADQPLRRARASAAARRHVALRSHPHAAAQRRRKSPTCWRRPSAATSRCRPTIATTSAAPSRRWPTAAPAYVRALGDDDGRRWRHAAAIRSARWPRCSSPDGALDHWCRFCYELRLHRARGYGALKAILDILAEEEPLTLTEISQRLQRTPGSTKDYLSWLEDVDLVVVAAEALQLHRSAAARLGAAALPPDAADRGRRRARSAPLRAAAPAAAEAAHVAWPAAGRRRAQGWGIIEID